MFGEEILYSNSWGILKHRERYVETNFLLMDLLSGQARQKKHLEKLNRLDYVPIFRCQGPKDLFSAIRQISQVKDR